MSSDKVIDLTHIAGTDVSLGIKDPERWVSVGWDEEKFYRILIPMNQDVARIELEANDVDVYSAPLLLQRWADVLETHLITGEEPKETIYLDRQGVDLFSVPCLLRMWGYHLHNELINAGLHPEEVVDSGEAGNEVSGEAEAECENPVAAVESC